MEKKEAIVALTYIISGALLQMFNGVEDGFASTIITIFGFIMFFTGLGNLRNLIDPAGQSAANLLRAAALVGAASAVIDLIPFIGGIIATIGYLFAFIIELIGLNQFKSSRTFGATGKSGFTLLTVAMVLAVVRAIFGFIPFFGGIIASVLSIIAVMLILMGWMKVQEDLAERFVTE